MPDKIIQGSKRTHLTLLERIRNRSLSCDFPSFPVFCATKMPLYTARSFSGFALLSITYDSFSQHAVFILYPVFYANLS